VRKVPRLEERQQIAAAAGLVLLLGPTTLIALALIIATIWMIVLGMHPHAPLWGWLSTTKKAQDGHTIWSPGLAPILYVWGVVNAYLLYQLCEILAGLFRSFRRALR
jgi:hypothetical protein